MPNPIPPPIQPPQQPGGTNPAQNGYAVPFMLAEWARLMLVFIGHNDQVPEKIRGDLLEWVHLYNAALTEYMMGTYGIFGTMHANSISAHMAQHLMGAIEEGKTAADSDFFQNLEEQMKQGDDQSS